MNTSQQHTRCREAEQPQIGFRDALEDSAPALERVGVDLVELVEVAEDDGVVRKSVLTARRQNHFGRNFLA